MSALASLSAALAWTEWLVGLAIALQTLELLVLWRAWSDTGIWRWSLLAPEQRSLPAALRWPLALLLPARAFGLLLGLRMLAALALVLGAGQGLAPFLLLAQVLICVRFRGSFNGGSDSFSVVLLSALSLAQLLDSSKQAQEAALSYIAVQLTLAYFISGMAKLQHAEWRSGRALGGFIASGRYGTPPLLARWLDGSMRLRLVAWGVLAFECGFPLAWLGPRASVAFIGLGLCFHLGTWLLFGLNRFVFAWAAAYPALLWCCHWLQ